MAPSSGAILCAETPTHVGLLPAYSDARAVQDRSFCMLCLPTRQEHVIKSYPQRHASDIVEKVMKRNTKLIIFLVYRDLLDNEFCDCLSLNVSVSQFLLPSGSSRAYPPQPSGDTRAAARKRQHATLQAFIVTNPNTRHSQGNASSAQRSRVCTIPLGHTGQTASAARTRARSVKSRANKLRTVQFGLVEEHADAH